jgi:predicted DNA-binding protein
MTTTIHIPPELLERIDARAKALRTSRNRVIVSAIEAELGGREAWPPELVQMLREPLDRDTAKLLDASMDSVAERRASRRGAPTL